MRRIFGFRVSAAWTAFDEQNQQNKEKYDSDEYCNEYEGVKWLQKTKILDFFRWNCRKSFTTKNESDMTTSGDDESSPSVFVEKISTGTIPWAGWAVFVVRMYSNESLIPLKLGDGNFLAT